MSVSLSCGQPVEVKPSQTKIVAYSLFPAQSTATSGYVLARAGVNNNGPVRVRLVDENGNALSNYVDSYSSYITKLPLTNVNITTTNEPVVVRVEVVNKSTVEQSYASVHDVLLQLS
uniref:Uncharacterized protein n=1 Tax=viral metagenome TaxID=1070528 RepID=A0A6C0IWF2_9ZZZZ